MIRVAGQFDALHRAICKFCVDCFVFADAPPFRCINCCPSCLPSSLLPTHSTNLRTLAVQTMLRLPTQDHTTYPYFALHSMITQLLALVLTGES